MNGPQGIIKGYVRDNTGIAEVRVDGQLVILHDSIGLFWEFKSKFVKRYCEAGELIQMALESYASEVKSGKFPTQENF